MERATWCNSPACFPVGLLSLIWGISVFEFNYFTFLCGSVAHSDGLLPGSLAQSSDLRLFASCINSFQMPLDRKIQVFTLLLALSFTENKNPRLVLLQSLTSCSAHNTLFSACLLLWVDIVLYIILAFQKYFIDRATYCFRRQSRIYSVSNSSFAYF